MKTNWLDIVDRALLFALSLLVVFAAACGSTGEAAPASQGAALGVVDFENSGAAAAQESFRSGVLFMHNFEYEDAATAFRAAQEADPDFALAYWGEALSYNHPVWLQQDREAAIGVLGRLADSAEARSAKATTAREKAYMDAVETLYGNTPESMGRSKEERDDLYRESMRRLYEDYPDDHEAGAFYALSILGSAHEGRDFATYMRAAAVVEPIFEANKDHPGAAHYLIHSYDDPIHAPLGLPMARAYSRIAPDAGHAQHMTSHIFVAMGLWDDVVDANVNARDVQNGRLARLERQPNVCGHYTYWLEYGYLMQGRLDAAREVLDACYERIQASPNASERGYFTAMRARFFMDAGDLGAADRYVMEDGPAMDHDYEVVNAVAAAFGGELDRARRIHAAMLADIESRGSAAGSAAPVLAEGLGGALTVLEGREEEGLEALRAAAAMEAALPYEFGPPAVVKPMYELLGEFLLQAGHAAEAAEAFRVQLDRTPLRTRAMIGLSQAAAATGEAVLAAELAERIGAVWHSADPGVRDELGSGIGETGS